MFTVHVTGKTKGVDRMYTGSGVAIVTTNRDKGDVDVTIGIDVYIIGDVLSVAAGIGEAIKRLANDMPDEKAREWMYRHTLMRIAEAFPEKFEKKEADEDDTA